MYFEIPTDVFIELGHCYGYICRVIQGVCWTLQRLYNTYLGAIVPKTLIL